LIIFREDSTIAVIVDGQRIEDKQIEAEFGRLWPDYQQTFANQSPRKQKEQLLEWSRENLIEKVLLEQYAARNGPQISDSRIDAAFENVIKRPQEQGVPFDSNERERLKADIGRQLKVLGALQQLGKGTDEPGEEQINRFYQENGEQFRTSEQVRVSHIVKHIDWQSDDTEAQDIINQAKELLERGASFESLVSRYSDCPENGGDIGFISRGQMVEEFEDVVFNLGAGQISGVFRSRYGFHIAKVYDRRPAVIRSFEQVKSEIKQKLIQQNRDKAIEKLLDKLRAEAKIEYI